MPLFRRFDRPGLLGDVTSSAVMTGTPAMRARAVTRSVGARTTPEPVATLPGESVSSQLTTLNALKQSGAISEAEYTQAKKRVLGP